MNISVVGTGLTKFGELWSKSLSDLILESSTEAIADAQMEHKDIDAVFVANMLHGKLAGQDHLGAVATTLLGINCPAFRIEGACASGGLAIHLAIQSLLAGTYKNVLIVGAEKMTDVSSSEVSAALMGAGSEEERKAGLTFPGLYALMATSHMAKYGTTKKDLASVAVKNHFHASLNKKAQFPFEITEDKALQSSQISTPFTLFDASPLSDGAAAVVLSSNEKLSDVHIKASTVATDAIGLSQRKSLTEIEATQVAAKQAYEIAGIEPKDIDLAEVHDCFTIAEILAMEDLGFCEKGMGGKFVRSKKTYLYGRQPVNTSGGLKACGHPVAATGVKQIVELTQQLQGRMGKRQVKKAKIGLAQNVGGTGATVVIHVLQR